MRASLIVREIETPAKRDLLGERNPDFIHLFPAKFYGTNPQHFQEFLAIELSAGAVASCLSSG
jgi:hypothetical protein